MTTLFRHRVHLIMDADNVPAPFSFRTDVIMPVIDSARAEHTARVIARAVNDGLDNPRVLSVASVERTYLHEKGPGANGAGPR